MNSFLLLLIVMPFGYKERRKASFMRDWHRLFAIILTDYFTGTGYEVEIEKDLSLKKQLLDVVIIQRRKKAKIKNICDGFEELAPHNLVTFKSIRETLTGWVIEELIGHYVNYRKYLGSRQVNPKNIQLYAVTTRFPRELAKTINFVKISH